MLYIIVSDVILMLMDKSSQIAAFHGKTQEFMVVGQIRGFYESHDGREKFTALVMFWFTRVFGK